MPGQKQPDTTKQMFSSLQLSEKFLQFSELEMTDFVHSLSYDELQAGDLILFGDQSSESIDAASGPLSVIMPVLEREISRRRERAQHHFRYTYLSYRQLGESRREDGYGFGRFLQSEQKHLPVMKMLYVLDLDQSGSPPAKLFLDWVIGFEEGITPWPLGPSPPSIQLFVTDLPIRLSAEFKHYRVGIYDRKLTGLNLSVEDYFAELYERQQLAIAGYTPAPAPPIDPDADPDRYRHAVPGIPTDILTGQSRKFVVFQSESAPLLTSSLSDPGWL